MTREQHDAMALRFQHELLVGHSNVEDYNDEIDWLEHQPIEGGEQA